MVEEALVGHLEHAADVARLVLVEKQIGGRSVGVVAVVALKKSERNQRVEKVARGAGMQAEACP